MENIRKKVELVTERVINSEMFGEVIPHLDSEYGYQVSIKSKVYPDLLYQVIIAEDVKRLGVYKKDEKGKYKYVKSKGMIDYDKDYDSLFDYFDYAGYTEFAEEYRCLMRIVGFEEPVRRIQRVQEEMPMKKMEIFIDDVFDEKAYHSYVSEDSMFNVMQPDSGSMFRKNVKKKNSI